MKYKINIPWYFTENVNLKNSYYIIRNKNEIAENEPLIIRADIEYVEQNFTYQTKFWQLLKWAWIQYFSIMILFVFISRKIKKFLFQNRILQTIKIPPSEE